MTETEAVVAVAMVMEAAMAVEMEEAEEEVVVVASKLQRRKDQRNQLLQRQLMYHREAGDAGTGVTSSVNSRIVPPAPAPMESVYAFDAQRVPFGNSLADDKSSCCMGE